MLHEQPAAFFILVSKGSNSSVLVIAIATETLHQDKPIDSPGGFRLATENRKTVHLPIWNSENVIRPESAIVWRYAIEQEFVDASAPQKILSGWSQKPLGLNMSIAELAR